MNDIIDAWNALKDTEAEHRLFDSYVKARDSYLSIIRLRVNGGASSDEVRRLCEAEIEAFKAYLNQRRRAKSE